LFLSTLLSFSKKNKSKLSKSNKRVLEKILARSVYAYEIVSTSLASEIASIALEIKEDVACLIDRQGRIKDVYFGEISKIEIKAQTAREESFLLAQLRLVIASKEKKIKKSSLLILKKYRLDSLIFIHANKNSEFSKSKGEYLKFADYAQLISLNKEKSLFYQISQPKTLLEISKIDFQEYIRDLEESLMTAASQIQSTKQAEMAILVGIQKKNQKEKEKEKESFRELKRLVQTAGAQTVGTIFQNIKTPDLRFFIKSGKLQELDLLIQEKEADLVIFDHELSPSQTRNIEKALASSVKVIDRTELILDIFAQRAQSQEGQLQVELAQLEYLAPKLIGQGINLSRLGGGIGSRGPGESKLETQRRKIKDRISFLQQKVGQISKIRQTQKRARKKSEIRTVSLAGYTNAGKSTLFNLLTNSSVLTEDKLFATLDPKTRLVKHNQKEFLISDTVGFIQNLPTSLVKSFRATLEQVKEADLILIILESNHPKKFKHLEIIEKLFKQELAIDKYQGKLVFNKIDLLTELELRNLKEEYPEALFVSSVGQDKKAYFQEFLDCLSQLLF